MPALNVWDEFTLEAAFADALEIAAEVRAALPGLRVIERAETGVGFLSTLKAAAALPERSASQLYRRASTGQLFSFDVWLHADGTIDLEAVVVGEGDWPADMTPSELELA